MMGNPGSGELREAACLSAETDRGAVWFVWGVWAGMLLAALAFIGHFSRNVPFWDDWVVTVGVVTDSPSEKPTLHWLWMQMGESRIPLPKLVLAGIIKLAGVDYRAAFLFNVLACGVLSFVLVRVAGVLRGRTAYADAFFPLALLNWGHCEVFLWSTMVYFSTPLLLAGALLVLIVRCRRRLTLGAALAAGVCFILLPLCGIYGLLFVPPLLIWYVLLAAQTIRLDGPHGRRDGRVALGMALVSLLVAAGYFVGFDRSLAMNDAPKAFPEVVYNSLYIFAMILGHAGRALFPYGGAVAVAVLLAALAFLTVMLAFVPWAEWPRVLGLCAFISILVLTPVAMGYRVQEAGMGFVLYYGFLPLLALLGAYFAWVLYGPPPLRSFAQACLLALAASVLSVNTSEGLAFARERRDLLAKVEADIAAGMPLSKVVQRNLRGVLWSEDPDGSYEYQRLPLLNGMTWLKHSRAGAFQHLKDDPPAGELQELRLPLTLLVTYNMTWEDGRGAVAAPDSAVHLALPEPRFVEAIRLKTYCPDQKKNPTALKVLWRTGDQAPLSGDDHDGTVKPTDTKALPVVGASAVGLLAAPGGAGPLHATSALFPGRTGVPGEQHETVWVHDMLDQVYLGWSGKPVKVLEIVFLVPRNRS